ncbi:MAG: hypothetical protein IJL58_01280, partial [Bacteroidales bacterium]|nr:hypothetical protein [Bacteroidales bacterium]
MTGLDKPASPNFPDGQQAFFDERLDEIPEFLEGKHLAVPISRFFCESVNRFRPFFHWLFDNARCNQPNGKSIRCKIAADIPAKSLT